MAKMTIEEFRKIKQRMIDYLNKNARNQDEEELISGYYAIQEELLESDLSDIPFEEWKGVPLVGKNCEYLDLSKTHANIDFNLLEECAYERINLKGCNVRGIDKIYYDEDTFDEEFMSSHPEYFPSKDLPPEIKKKFYDQKITIKDLILYPNLRQNISNVAFMYSNRVDKELIKILGSDYLVQLIEDYPEFMMHIFDKETDEFSYMSQAVDTKVMIKENITSYESAKMEFFKGYFAEMSHAFSPKLDLQIIPKEIIDKFPQYFVEKEELPNDVKEAFYSGDLSTATIRYYKDILLQKDLSLAIKKNRNCQKIITLFGSLERYFSLVERELDYEVEAYLQNQDYSGTKEYTELKDEEIKDFIIGVIRYNESSPYYGRKADDIATFYAYSKYLPLESVLDSKELIQVFNKIGFEKLIEFDKYCHWVLDLGGTRGIEDTLIYKLAQYAVKDPEFEILEFNSNEELHTYFSKLFEQMRLEENIYSYTRFVEGLEKYLMKSFPKQIITKEELQNIIPDLYHDYSNVVAAFNGDTTQLLTIMQKYPKLLEVFKEKNLLIKDKELKQIYDVLGKEQFLDLCVKYGASLADFSKELSGKNIENILAILKTNQNSEEIINEYLYRKISNKRTIDVRTLPESFKRQHPELYLKEDAPKQLIEAFYGTKWWDSFHLLHAGDIKNHPEWIEHLQHIDIDKCFQYVNINVVGKPNSQGQSFGYGTSLYFILQSFCTKEEIFQLMVEYGNHLSEVQVNYHEGMGKKEFEEELQKGIYQKVLNRNLPLLKEYLPKKLVDAHPELFISEQAPDELKSLYYKRDIDGEILQEHPEYIEYLENIDLKLVVSSNFFTFVKTLSDAKYSNKEILELMQRYSDYIPASKLDLVELQYCKKDEIDLVLRGQIINSILYKKTPYKEDLLPLIGDMHPELFLDKDAPEDLKKIFYWDHFPLTLTFHELKEHKEWLPYLKGKNALLSLSRDAIPRLANAMEQLFERYGQDEALKIGMKNPDAVMHMLSNNKIDILCTWYERLKFVPHHVIMNNFALEDIDKFAAAGKLWSRITRIENHNYNNEVREALLKASICFGVFDQDKDGFNKLVSLFSDIPRKLSQEEIDKIKEFLTKNIEKYQEDEKQQALLEKYKLGLEQLEQIYERRENGEYILVINGQENKETIKLFRDIMEKAGTSGVITPEQSHQLFGAFQNKYMPDFRDFLLENIDTILASDDYISQISNMQARWEEIKAYNSNIKLTLELAMAYIMSNSYTNVHTGNQRLANTISSAGYAQADFEALQEIYNYGKTRVFSSIPRVKDSVDGYTYEIIKLDDPQALVIGKLTDCCQELGNAAQTSMEHSMTDKHGRLFIVKDEKGNVVAQSWVWRNKNVLCFDNIEVPGKAFSRATKEGKDRKEFTDEIFGVYKHAAEALLEQDEAMYRQLLEEGKITEEQFEALKLAKVTVGAGYNDVKDSLNRNASEDKTRVSHPLEYTHPITGDHYLYTSDSNAQYVIAGSEEVPQSTMETITPYSDEYTIFDDSNIKEQDILTLQKLEVITKREKYEGHTQVYDFDDPVTSIAYNYNLHPRKTKIVMNPNFAIIYEKTDDTIIIGDILYNTSIHANTNPVDITDRVALQIRMAMEQIGMKPENIDTSRLDDGAKAMCGKALGLKEELDTERGVGHGK